MISFILGIATGALLMMALYFWQRSKWDKLLRETREELAKHNIPVPPSTE